MRCAAPSTRSTTAPAWRGYRVISRHRHHREAALRPPGRRRGELQSEQAGTTVAQLSLLHDGQSAPRAGGGGRARQPPYVQAFLTAIVGVVGWPRRRTAALADSRRCRVRQRAGDVRSRAAPPALSVQAAPDQTGEARGRAGDARAGLAECRGALAGEGRALAA